MKKVQFTLNGKSVSVGGPGPRAQQVLDFIRSIPRDKYFDAAGIGECLKCSRHSIEHILHAHAGEVADHVLFVPRSGGAAKRIYGKKASVASLRRKLKKSDLI